uniref:Serine/threonine/tyrosine interacting like 1 n=1 Tax=Podarcis muralis TaxID=64176 RepID=A0A670JR88_PODMU
MAGVALCEPTELYNMLNQSTKISRLAEPNYLCLMDARTRREYNESHLMTAIRVRKELEAFKPYPVEILPARLYMGNYAQACDSQIQKDLKIKAHLNVCEEAGTFFLEDSDRLLHIPIPDSPDADMFSYFPKICHFIGEVLVFSTMGISRCSTAVMAYLMHSCRLYLKKSWSYVQKCKINMRPNRGFVRQLSEWETRIYLSDITDISEPNY